MWNTRQDIQLLAVAHLLGYWMRGISPDADGQLKDCREMCRLQMRGAGTCFENDRARIWSVRQDDPCAMSEDGRSVTYIHLPPEIPVGSGTVWRLGWKDAEGCITNTPSTILHFGDRDLASALITGYLPAGHSPAGTGFPWRLLSMVGDVSISLRPVVDCPQPTELEGVDHWLRILPPETRQPRREAVLRCGKPDPGTDFPWRMDNGQVADARCWWLCTEPGKPDTCRQVWDVEGVVSFVRGGQDAIPDGQA